MFSKVEVYLSIGGEFFPSYPFLEMDFLPDSKSNGPHNITLAIGGAGSAFRLKLHFSSLWIMVSEVTFRSG